MASNTITLTFGDVCENHVNMQKIGQLSETGFELTDLLYAKQQFELKNYECSLIDLDRDAYILIIRGGAACLLEPHTVTELYNEQTNLIPDKKALMYGRVVNKIARHNLCFDNVGQLPDYENGKGTVISYDSVPLTESIQRKLPEYFGDKAADLKCEGNYYYDSSKCGIGYHGDSERMKVIGLRLGDTIPLCYKWFYKGEQIGDKITILLNNGDMYMMNQKATGNDWKNRSIYTLRHAAGAPKYTD